MKFRTRKFRIKRLTFGRGPHYLFYRKSRSDVEDMVFFGSVPMRTVEGTHNFQGIVKIKFESEERIGKIMGTRSTLIMIDDITEDSIHESSNSSSK